MAKKRTYEDIQGWSVEDGTFRFGGEDRGAIYARDPKGPANEFCVIFPTKDNPASEEELLERLELSVLQRQVQRGDKDAEKNLAYHEAVMSANETVRRARRGIFPGPGDASIKR